MTTVVLACKRFRGRHTAHNIMEEYEETVQIFDIHTKTTNFVTDNDANVISGFSFPGFSDILTMMTWTPVLILKTN